MIPPAPSRPDEVRPPRAGEAFLQLGSRFVVIEVDEASGLVHHFSHANDYTGPVCTTNLQTFLEFLALGFIERA